MVAVLCTGWVVMRLITGADEVKRRRENAVLKHRAVRPGFVNEKEAIAGKGKADQELSVSGEVSPRSL